MAIETPSTAFALPANNGTTTYTFSFIKTEDDDVFIYLFNTSTGNYDLKTVTTHYTISGDTVTFNSAPTTQVLILRRTDLNSLKVPNFIPGSAIRGADLDSNFAQLIQVNQEFRDLKVDKYISPSIEADLDMNSNRIEVLADAAVDTDAVNRGQLAKVITDDLIAGQAITLTDAVAGTNSGDQVTISVTDDSITSAMIKDGTILNVDINANADIDGSKLLDDTVTSAKITDGTIVNADINAAAAITGSKLADNSIDLGKILDADIINTVDYSTSWTDDDTHIATAGALQKRHDVTIGNTDITTTHVGKLHYNDTVGAQALKIWNGSAWVALTSGTPYVPTDSTIVRYVDATNGSDASDVTGFLINSPLASIARALELVNTDSADGTLILVAPGVYQETLPLVINQNNVSIVGQALRSCFVQPTQATETNTMFECNSGTLLANMTFVGLKANGTRGGSASIDPDVLYGLPAEQGWVAAFKSGAVIKKSPYIQNCTSFSDSSINNNDPYDQTNLPAGGLGGDTSSEMTGGGILCDGATPATTSPLRSFVVDSFTQINLDGPGILCTNNGYAQLVSFFGTFCHYHAKALNGGQLNLSNCTTDFGTYGLIADGKSPNPVITGAVNGVTNAASTTVVVDGLALANNFTTNQPGTTMVMEVGSDLYQVLSATAVTGNQSTVTVFRATIAAPSVNAGITNQIADNAVANFYLRSYISTGGHTFEYVGSGTNYNAHPDFGGVAIEDNQIIELGGVGAAADQVYNRGKVWQTSTDENGLFKVGPSFKVDQRKNTVSIDNFVVATNVESDSTPKLGGNLDVGGNEIKTVEGNLPIVLNPHGTGAVNVSTSKIINVTDPTSAQDAATKAYVDTGIAAINVVVDTTPQLGGELDAQTNKIVNLGTPTNATDAATKAYAEAYAESLFTSATDTDLILTASGTGLVKVVENGLSAVPIVTQHDVGTDENEIPTNSMLGSMSLQNSDAIAASGPVSINDNEVRFKETNSEGQHHVSITAPTSLAANTTLTLPSTTGTLALTSSLPASTKIAYVFDEKPSITDGGTFTSGDWRTRDLGHENDPNSIVSVTSTQFTLSVNGDYYIHFSAPAFDVNRHQARLANITDTEYTYGNVSISDTTDPSDTLSQGHAFITISGSSKTFEVQHRAFTTKTTNGFGIAGDFGNVEVYTQVVIHKLT